MPRDVRTTEIVLESICVTGWGVGSWGHPWILLMMLWSGRFVKSCVLRWASDIRPCYLRNGMKLGRRGGFSLLPGLEYVTQVVGCLELLFTVDSWRVVHCSCKCLEHMNEAILRCETTFS